MLHQLSIWEEQKNPMVRMHNYLVTANLGYLELSSLRIFLIMIAKLKWDDKELLPVKISLKDILPSYKGGDHINVIVKACDELKSKMQDVRILSIENGKKVYVRMTVIDSVKYIEDTDYIEADFGKKIKPYLIDLKEHFTQAELRELMNLKSTHAIRFYLLVKSLYRAGETYSVSVDELKLKLLGNTDLYPEYKIFKRDVLNTTQKALAKTTAAFEFEEARKGRAVHTLHIKPITYPKLKIAPSVISEDVYTLLTNLKVNTSRICQLLEENEITEEYILYVVGIKQKDKKVKRIAGAIYDAIVNKHLWEEFNILQKKGSNHSQSPIIISPSGDFTTITLKEAEQMYYKAREEGKTKFAFSGFVKGLKTGKNIIVSGYNY